MAARLKATTKGGAAGKGITKPRMSAAQKALLPQGLCSGGCGKSGVVGMKHSTWSKEESKAVACGYLTCTGSELLCSD